MTIEAFNRSGHRLIVVGDGPERPRLMRSARSNVEFTGWVSSKELRDLYRGARALVFPGREDFGIVPVEARCCGCPVIAFAEGGAEEILKDGVNSILIQKQTVGDLMEALDRFERIEWSQLSIRKGTTRFSRERFKSQIEDFIQTHHHVGRATAASFNPGS